MQKIFENSITVLLDDIDVMGHVNNIIYLRWVQEAAIAHWNSLATDQMKKDYVWVVVRHEIDYLASAKLESELVARTWIGEHSGVKSERFVNICDKHSDKIYAKVKTVWCLLDAKTLRPKRIESDIVNAFL
jgi:acyl-CoA thioester hydrolase